MWSKTKIIELKIKPGNCCDYVECAGQTCNECLETNANKIAEGVIEMKSFLIRSQTVRILKDKGLDISNIDNESARQTVIDYIDEDFKDIFNELKNGV